MNVIKRVLAAAVVVVSVASLGAVLATQRADEAVKVPGPMFDPAPATAGTARAVFAGGCFWGVQGVFQHVKGVRLVLAGYSGGQTKNPSYEDVVTETTGHAEAVEITYDPATVSYGKLLQVFFSVAHNPTELNRQGPDEGPSYRSNIFYLNDAQKNVAEAYIAQLDKAHVFPRAIVTRVDRFSAFYRAEDYHQDFLIQHPTYPYIVINDLPKVANFKRLLPELYQAEPVTTGK